jgi:hypothetical protein
MQTPLWFTLIGTSLAALALHAFFVQRHPLRRLIA